MAVVVAVVVSLVVTDVDVAVIAAALAIVVAATLRAISLTMFQSLMDMETFIEFNRKYAAVLLDQRLA